MFLLTADKLDYHPWDITHYANKEHWDYAGRPEIGDFRVVASSWRASHESPQFAIVIGNDNDRDAARSEKLTESLSG